MDATEVHTQEEGSAKDPMRKDAKTGWWEKLSPLEDLQFDFRLLGRMKDGIAKDSRGEG